MMAKVDTPLGYKSIVRDRWSWFLLLLAVTKMPQQKQFQDGKDFGAHSSGLVPASRRVTAEGA